MILNMNGGGGASLNFKVVGGTAEPANPKENTIWVDTDIEITKWLFSATEPEEPSEGMVWFATDTSSSIQFNALKKNDFTVYPCGARQYVDGMWINKIAKIYQGGEWINLLLYLYTAGDEHTEITGGWVAMKLPRSAGTISEGDKGEMLTVTRESTGLTLYAGWGGGILYCQNKIDLTHFKTLTFTGIGLTNETFRVQLLIWTALGSHWDSNKVAYHYVDANVVSIDVSSLSGEYIIGFGGQGYKGITIYELKLEA